MKSLYVVAGLVSLLLSCATKSVKTKETVGEPSIWRDNNGKDPASYFGSQETCEQILGEYNSTMILHKGFENSPNTFAGTPYKRKYIFRGDSVFNIQINTGKLMDKGRFSCLEGKMKVNWEKDRDIEYEVYFRDKNTVELRYFDYLKNLNFYLFGDSTSIVGTPNTPSKIIAVRN